MSRCTRYTIRRRDNFSISHTKKSYIKNSFFWFVLDDWNRLDLNIKESNSIKLFKTKRHQKLSKLSNLHNKTSSQGSVHHTRMRMGTSALNAQRRKYNFIKVHVLCVWELKILTISFSFVRSRPPHAPHFCPGYSRYWEISLSNMFYSLLANLRPSCIDCY